MQLNNHRICLPTGRIAAAAAEKKKIYKIRITRNHVQPTDTWRHVQKKRETYRECAEITDFFTQESDAGTEILSKT